MYRSALGDFWHQPAKFRKSSPLASARLRKSEHFLTSTFAQGWPSSCPMGGEHHVFRAALFSIVLTLAVGPNASLLCKAWCPDTTSAGCPHQESTTSPSVSAYDNCRTDIGTAVAFFREDARRTAAAPDAQNSLAVPRFLLALSYIDLGFGWEFGRRLLFEERPLVIALRI